ncbi:MAG: 6-phosphogluconate dehydrogenase, partial [Kiritimatiellaceae bacterium]|nr:6-phosphogluconate dehydrogenase [Kiritimatiellaceae bacterium]
KKTLAPVDGYLHVGPSGAGHFVKMIHNGIEYGMLQAYAEGFELLNGKKAFNLDLYKISKLWGQGSVIRSWLLDLAVNVFETNPKLDGIEGYVEDSGEGRWTVAEAIEQSVPAPVITASLLHRFASRQPESFCSQTIAALRKQFGGHGIKNK